MSDNYLKTPLAQSLNNLAEKKAHKALQATGRSLPCSVTEVISPGIVRVKFEVDAAPFTLPELVVVKEGSPYVRLPTQVGEKGWVKSADARLGGVTGLGAGIASLAQPGNLAALVYAPLGNTEWSGDDDVTIIYGVNFIGAAIITPTSASLFFGANSIEITASGVFITGPLTINGTTYLAHHHGGVTPGGGISGGIVP